MAEQSSLFEEEREKEEEKRAKVSRQVRSEKLIADFVDGHAQGWHFAVPDVFRNELDIKVTERKEPVLDENGEIIYVDKRDKHGNIEYKKDGTPKKRRKTRSVYPWTQGKMHCFAEGHVIHDKPLNFNKWSDALKQFDLMIEVLRAVPCSQEPKNAFVPGSVTFKLMKPNKERTGLEDVGQYHLTQVEFVEYLKTGKLKDGAADGKH